MNIRYINYIFLVFIGFFYNLEAFSAERKVCFKMQFADSRTNCPSATENGARRGCKTDGSYSDMVGHYIEAWDKDTGSGSDDEYIGLWYLVKGGSQCITFEWENANYSKGEANPDVYLKYINRVRKTSGKSIYVEARNHKGDKHTKTSWRNGKSSDSNLFVANNCKFGSSCRISGTMIPTRDTASQRGKRIMALDSVQHALEVYGGIMDQNVHMRYPCNPNGCSSSRAISQTVFDIDDDQSVTNGKVPPHEIGHVLQKQLFNQNPLSNIKDKKSCDRNGSGHSLTSIEWENCATKEGWADYVAVVSWYDPDNSNVSPRYSGYDIERANPYHRSCSDNAHSELQVAKAFWDLDDANNERAVFPASGDDRKNSSTTFIANGWRQFPDGTGNGDDLESGIDGINVRDYYRNNKNRFSGSFFETLIEHNCLSAQSNG